MGKQPKERKSPYTLYLLWDDDKGNQRPSNQAISKGHFTGLKEARKWVESDDGDGFWRCEKDFSELARELREKSERVIWSAKPAIDIPCLAVAEIIDHSGRLGIYWLMREPGED